MRSTSHSPQCTAAAGDDCYRQLLEAAPDPVLLVALDGQDARRILDANELAVVAFGYPRDVLLQLRLEDLEPRAQAADLSPHLRELGEQGFVHFATTQRRCDGSTFPVEVSARVTTLAGRRCAVTFHRDVSTRHEVQARLRDNQWRLAVAARAANIGFWDWDLATDTVFFSPEWKAQLGYEPHEIAHRLDEWRTRTHPDDVEPTLAAVAAHRRTDLPFDGEFRMRHRDGSWRWIYSRGHTVRDADGRPVRMLGCHVDITERKLATERQREAERALRTFYDSPGVLRGLVALTADDDIVHLSDNAVTGHFFGVDPATLVGRRASELGVPTDVRRLWVEHYRRSEREGVPITFDYAHASTSGTTWLAVTVSCLGAVDGVVRFTYSAIDQTPRKVAEHRAEATAARMRAIYETEPECIMVLQCDGSLVDMNPAGLAMLEADALDDVRGLDMAEPVLATDRAAFVAMCRCAASGQPSVLEYPIRGRRGGEHVVETHAVPLRDADGAITGILAVSRDITARRRAEAERAAMARQVEQLQRLEALGTLSGGIAHDFNNILAVITGNLELALQEAPGSVHAHENLLEIKKASERARKLVRQILTFSRTQAPERHALAIGPMVEEVGRFLRATIPTGIAIETRIGAQVPEVLADATQIHQVLVNLGTNAWHAMEGRPGELLFAVDAVDLDAAAAAALGRLQPGPHVRLTVRDTGVGMDAATVKRVFEPFFTTKAPGRGTGLGLSVVHGIVHSHGGAITVDSEPGVGTTFRVWLPATQLAVAAAEAPTPVARGRDEHILLVDDELALVVAISRGLRNAGYRVTVAATAEAALAEVATASDLRAVVTDHEMPGRTGLAIAQRIRAMRPDLPVLLCSGHLHPEITAAAAQAGIRRLLTKPLGLADLTAALRQCLDAPAAAVVLQPAEPTQLPHRRQSTSAPR